MISRTEEVHEEIETVEYSDGYSDGTALRVKIPGAGLCFHSLTHVRHWRPIQVKPHGYHRPTVCPLQQVNHSGQATSQPFRSSHWEDTVSHCCIWSKQVSQLVFYTQWSSAVISGRVVSGTYSSSHWEDTVSHCRIWNKSTIQFKPQVNHSVQATASHCRVWNKSTIQVKPQSHIADLEQVNHSGQATGRIQSHIVASGTSQPFSLTSSHLEQVNNSRQAAGRIQSHIVGSGTSQTFSSIHRENTVSHCRIWSKYVSWYFTPCQPVRL